MNNIENKIFFFLVYLVIFIGISFYYGPSIVFYFDQTNGDAVITSKKGNIIYLEYFHNEKNKKFKMYYKCENLEIQEIIPNKKVEILYSKSFPSCIAFLNCGDTPDLSKLIIIIISLIPLIFYKNILDELDY